MDHLVEAIEGLKLSVDKLNLDVFYRNKEFCEYQRYLKEEVFLALILFESGLVRLDYYCPRLNKWTFMGNIKLQHHFPHSVLLNDELLFSGGINKNKYVHDVISLNLKTMVQKYLPCTNTGRFNHSMAVCSGFVYIVGGRYTDTVERWSPGSKSWSYVAPMNGARWMTGIAVLNDNLYVIGGYNKTHTLKMVERYNPKTNIWTIMAPMKATRGSPGVTVCNGFIYVFGGQFNLNGITDLVERYDAATNTWSTVTTLKIPRYFIGCSTLDDSIYVAAGCDNTKSYADFQKYDVQNKKWTTLMPLSIVVKLYCLIKVPKRHCTSI